VTNTAFEAFPCTRPFDDGRKWLVADVSIECDTAAHDEATLLAWIAVIVYPFGFWFLTLNLLTRASPAIAGGYNTRLSDATSFLHAEYNPGEPSTCHA